MPPIDPALVEDPYPFQQHMGARITGWSEGYARFELPMEGFLMNRYGILHGGVHSVMADTCMGYCGCYTGDLANRKLAMTLNLSVNFLSQPKGKVLIAEGRQTGGGAKTFFAEALISDDLGTEIARATGVFRVRAAS
ncbi:PaaI family thioesterase [Pseudooceanicola aestuarii]|uniref:PaaI family thioesterase n=1 Tax=Pseudooceanicola aestuarii TaxID=2697319 RepID=UPI001EF9A177|nr:PaaI family thioesterase [Pseudooceanicola aestuarii]